MKYTATRSIDEMQLAAPASACNNTASCQFCVVAALELPCCLKLYTGADSSQSLPAMQIPVSQNGTRFANTLEALLNLAVCLKQTGLQ